MFFNFEIAYKCSVYGNDSKSYIKFQCKLLIANLYDLPIIDIAFAETQIMDTGSLLTNILYNSKFQFTVHKNEIIRLLLSKIASLPRRSTPTSAPTSKRKSCTIKTQEIS